MEVFKTYSPNGDILERMSVEGSEGVRCEVKVKCHRYALERVRFNDGNLVVLNFTENEQNIIINKPTEK